MFVQTHIQRVHRQRHNIHNQARNNPNNHQLVAGATNRLDSAAGLDRSIREKSVHGANDHQQSRWPRQEPESIIKRRALGDQVEVEPGLDNNREVRAQLHGKQRSRALIKLPGPCRSQTRARLVTKASYAKLKLRWHRSSIRISDLVKLSGDPDLLYHFRQSIKRNVDESTHELQPSNQHSRSSFMLKLELGARLNKYHQPIGRALKQTLDLLVLYLGNFIGFQWESLCHLFMGEPSLIFKPGCSGSQPRQQHMTFTEQGHIQNRRPETSFVEPLRYNSLDGFNANFDRSHAFPRTKPNSIDLPQECYTIIGQSATTKAYGSGVDYRQSAVPISIPRRIVRPSLGQAAGISGHIHQLQPDHHHGHLHQPHWIPATERTTLERMRLLPETQPSVRSSLNYNQRSDHRTDPPMSHSYLASQQNQNSQQGIRADLLHCGASSDAPADHMFWRWHTIDGSAPPLKTRCSHQYHEPKVEPTAQHDPFWASRSQTMPRNPINQQRISVSDPKLDSEALFEPVRNQIQYPMRSTELLAPLQNNQHNQHSQHHQHHHNHQWSIQARVQRTGGHSHDVNGGLSHYLSQSDPTRRQVGPFPVQCKDKFERKLSSIIGSDSENCAQISNRLTFFNSSPSLSSASSISSGLNQTKFAPYEPTHYVQPHPSALSSVGMLQPRPRIHPLEGRRLQRQASSTTSDASSNPRGRLGIGNQLTSALNKMSLEQHRHDQKAPRATGSKDHAVHLTDYKRAQSAMGHTSNVAIKSKSHSPPSSFDRNQRAPNDPATAPVASSVDIEDRKKEVESKGNSKKVSLKAGGKSKSLVYSSIGTTAVTFSKVSLAGAKRRLGFKQNRGINSLNVHRSEEIFPSDLGANFLSHQHTSTTTTTTTTGLYSLNDSFDQDSNQSSNAPRQPRARCLNRFSSESPDPKVNFVDGLGHGQIVSRQALVSPFLGDIQVSLSDRRGMLEVEVIRVRQLQPKPNAKRRPAISVKVYLMKDKKCLAKMKTTQISHTLSPMFQQSFVFRADYKDCVLQIIVWGDYGKRDRKSLMGIVQIHLNELDISDMIIGWYKLFNAQSMVANQLIASSSKSLRQNLSTTKLTDLDPIQGSPIVVK